MMRLSELTCTHCRGAGLELQPDGQAVCRFCGTANPIEGVVCSQCETLNPAEADACQACRQSLRRPCPDCGQRNWRGADHCARCGRLLDPVSAISTRWGTDPAHRLQELAHGSAAIKAQEAADSERRMAELQAIEQRRLELLSESRQRRDAQQRVWVTVLVVGMVVFGLLLAIALALAYAAN
jgi:Double zinc ribbon